MTSQFYRSRPKPPDAPSGEAYWVKKDPDGNVRNMLSLLERLTKAMDANDELKWVDGRRTLDVGCGVGTLLRYLSPKSEGLEPDGWAAHQAAQHSGRFVNVGTLDDMREAKCEAILCYHVIEHIEDPMRALAQMHALLAPGGRIVISTPDFDSPVARRWGENYRLLQDLTHISLFSTASLVSAMESVGFKIERVEHPWPERFRTPEHVLRLLDDPETTISPPAPGNVVSVYAVKA